MSDTNIISIDKRDKVDKETTNSNKLLEFTITYKYIFIFIIVALFVILLYFALFKTSKPKKNKKKKDSDSDSDSDDDTKEKFKQDVERSDPVDEYDLESDIKKLLKNQENYFEKINKFY